MEKYNGSVLSSPRKFVYDVVVVVVVVVGGVVIVPLLAHPERLIVESRKILIQ